MKIKMITRSAGPSGNMSPDTIYDVDPDQAKALVEGHFATYVDPQPVDQPAEIKTTEDPKETATAKRKKETAAKS